MRTLLAVCSLVLVAACGGSGEPEAPGTTAPVTATPTSASARSGAEAAVESLMRAWDAGDCRAVRAVVVTPSEVDCEVIRSAEGALATEGIDIDGIRYTAGPVQGSSSQVTITWGNEYPDESYDVERVDGTWLVILDTAA